MDDPRIAIRLTNEELQLVFQGLGELPARRSMSLLLRIEQDVLAENQRRAEAAVSAPEAAEAPEVAH